MATATDVARQAGADRQHNIGTHTAAATTVQLLEEEEEE